MLQNTLIQQEAVKKNTCPVHSYNEWGLLEEVIVGTPSNAFFSFGDPTDRLLYSPKEIAEIEKYIKFRQPYPAEYINKAKAAIDRFSHILVEEGVKVQPVAKVKYDRPFGTPDWRTPGGFCAANPRDLLFVTGNQIIEAPMSARSRYFEIRAYRKLLQDYAVQGAKIIAAPKPRLLDELYNPNYEHPNSPTPHVLTNVEPVFDAADFIRCGSDIIGQLSHVTNQAGVDWLQKCLGDDYTIHLIESLDPKPSHIDTTIALVGPGRVLVNPTFTDVNKLPDIFKNWEILVAPPPVPFKTKPQLMSNWISINTLMLDEERIIVEKRQTPLIKALKGWGFKPIPCDFEDHYPFIGGFHCATLDVRRQGILESYA